MKPGATTVPVPGRNSIDDTGLPGKEGEVGAVNGVEPAPTGQVTTGQILPDVEVVNELYNIMSADEPIEQPSPLPPRSAPSFAPPAFPSPAMPDIPPPKLPAEASTRMAPSTPAPSLTPPSMPAPSLPAAPEFGEGDGRQEGSGFDRKKSVYTGFGGDVVGLNTGDGGGSNDSGSDAAAADDGTAFGTNGGWPSDGPAAASARSLADALEKEREELASRNICSCTVAVHLCSCCTSLRIRVYDRVRENMCATMHWQHVLLVFYRMLIGCSH